MPRIFDMQLRRGRLERFLVTLSDQQQLILTPEIVLKYSISPNREYTDEEFAQILNEDTLRQAKDQAMRFLSLRQHSCMELGKKLRNKGFSSHTIEQTIKDLKKIKLLDDAQFAELYIDNEMQLRPVGKRLLRQKLVQRGVSAEIFEPLLDKYFYKETELKIARTLIQKFTKTHPKDRGQKFTEKLIRFLQSKGIDWDQIEQILYEQKNEL
jgi:regulatory protein